MTETDAEKILRLEKALRVAEAERDEFAADVERLCLASGGKVAKLEELATERTYAAEADNRKLRLELADTKSERDAAHAALGIAGDERAELSGELSQLRRQLEAAQLSDSQRQAALEASQLTCEGLSGEARELRAELESLRGTLEEGRGAREGLQSQVQSLQAEVEALRKQATARDLAESKELTKLRKSVAQLEEAANLSRTQLAEVQAEAMHTHKLLKQAHKIEDQLSTQVQQLQASLAAAKQAQQPSTPRKGGESASESASPQPQPAALSPPADGARSGPGGSPAPSPRSAAARALTASTAAAVTVTSAEAATPALAPDNGAEVSGSEAAPPGADALVAAAAAARTEATEAEAALAVAQLRVKELEGQLAAVREELEQERSGQSDEREQLQVLRTMVHDFKIKLAQATQEKVEALMRAANLTQEAQQQMQQHQAAAGGGSGGGAAAGGAGGGGGGGGSSSSSIPILQRIGSTLSASARERSEAAAQHSRRASRDAGVLSRSPSYANAQGQPAGTVPSPAGGSGTRSLWAAWMGGGSFTSSASAAAAAAAAGAGAAGSGALPPTSSGGGAAAASPRAGAAASPASLPPLHPPPHALAHDSTYAASVASEESADLDSAAAITAAAAAATAAASASASANAAAHAATVEAAEGRNRRLAAQLERVRGQLAAVDRLAAAVGRCLSQLEGAAGLLWSSREEDAPRRWAALRDLTRLAEACAAMRSEAGLPATAAAAPAAAAAAGAGASAGAAAAAAPRASPAPAVQAEPGVGVAGDSGGENDASVVCTRESGGVQRRVAEVLMGAVEFGVRSLEAYNHAAALSSVNMYG
ncbi:hypothetical protein HXX76_001120 [Chlamydomonas incerta]|uniref:Uncharacterized protein n=1 Tax=Chlamydomonas incerta TaxID=51695 RepID=A0A835WBL5_CHLIN|nr:hypothetical protein HXX76_001120 [Chlamydomonas incerta]|eukprot:KAG2444364.1 hypothetical protein HXX76_001120 [Chlamydomonas incerta]